MSWLTACRSQTLAQTLHSPVLKWMQASLSMNGTIGTAWRIGTRMAVIGPRQLVVDDLPAVLVLDRDAPGRAEIGAGRAADAGFRFLAEGGRDAALVPRSKKLMAVGPDDVLADPDAQAAEDALLVRP